MCKKDNSDTMNFVNLLAKEIGSSAEQSLQYQAKCFRELRSVQNKLNDVLSQLIFELGRVQLMDAKHQLLLLSITGKIQLCHKVIRDIQITLEGIKVNISDSVTTEDEATSDAGSVGSIGRGTFHSSSRRSRYNLNPEDLEKHLYSYSGTSDDSPCQQTADLGKIGFVLKYIVDKQELRITVLGCLNLPAKFQKGSADPFVKVSLLPDKHPKFTTKIKKNSLNPVFDETFRMFLKRSSVDDKVIKFTVNDYDRFSRRVVVGYACCSLKDVGITSETVMDVFTNEIWRDLVDKLGNNGLTSKKGELCISLNYLPEDGQLTLTVVKARDLGEFNQDPGSVYCKVTLYEGKKVIKSKKTDVKKRRADPIFEENFTIQVPRSYVNDVHCIISVYSKSKIGVRKLLGKVHVGPFAYVVGSGLDQWNDMLHSSNTTVVRWHKLT